MVTNEKEDLLERQIAEDGIKEYIAKQMQDLSTKHVEKTHELVFVKQKLSEANDEVNDVKREYQEQIDEIEALRAKLAKEIKVLKKRFKLSELENSEYKEIFDEMQEYIAKLHKAKRL
jgi:chromosome segregation ATPase